MSDVRKVFVRGLRLPAEIGLWKHERGRTQDVVLDIEMTLAPDLGRPTKLANLVRYDEAAVWAQEIIAAGHIELVETLADRVADRCLADPRVTRVRVRVEKPEAIAAAAGAGCEVDRGRDKVL